MSEPVLYKKYPAHVRERVYARILQLADKGETYERIALTLNTEGLKRPDGSDFTTRKAEECLAAARLQHKKRQFSTHPSLPSTSSSRLPQAVVAILTDSALTDAQKVKMVLAYADA